MPNVPVVTGAGAGRRAAAGAACWPPLRRWLARDMFNPAPVVAGGRRFIGS
jgi:hypothetical protein